MGERWLAVGNRTTIMCGGNKRQSWRWVSVLCIIIAFIGWECGGKLLYVWQGYSLDGFFGPTSTLERLDTVATYTFRH